MSDKIQPSPMTLQRIKNAVSNYSGHLLFRNYMSALDDYLQEVNFCNTPLPACLQNPLAYFYCRKRIIFSYDSFLYGRWQTFRVTFKTFPPFLRYWNIPIAKPEQCRNLLNALTALVQKYPYSEKDIWMKKIMQYDQHMAELLLQTRFSIHQHNLFFLASGKLFSWAPILFWDFSCFQSVPTSFIKNFFTAIINSQKDAGEQKTLLPEQPCVIFYSGSLHPKFCAVTYQAALEKTDIPALPFPTKALPYLRQPQSVPPNAAAWLFHFTGGDLTLVDRFALFLARASSPVPKGKQMTILCSRENAEELKAFLQQLLGPDFIAKDGKPAGSDGTLPSLNRLCQKSSLENLYREQNLGKGIVFAGDRPVSDSKRTTVKKLLESKKVSLSSKYLPKQNLYNTLHIVSISKEPGTAYRLSTSFSVELLDFSPHEIPCRALPELEHQDIAWLRTVFLPFGLTDPRRASKRQKTTASSDWVEEFLTQYCAVSAGNLCDGMTLYAAYDAFYRQMHPGLKTPLTKICFVKRVKTFIGKKAFKQVSYHKVRADQHWYFDGFVCPVELPTPPPPKPISAFSAHLDEIHQTRLKLSLSPNMQVKVIQQKSPF